MKITGAKPQVAAGSRLLRVIAFSGATLGSSMALAVPLNVDFGDAGGLPSSSFGAASGQVGLWNKITAFSTSAGIVDVHGNATGVAITVATFNMGGVDTLPPGDANDLMEDNFFSFPRTSWTISITGLADGLYDVYLYEPHNSLVGTGSGTVNGIGFGNINGGFASGTLIQGSNYHVLGGVAVAGGALVATGSDPSVFSGIAGMQLVPLSASVPEPSALALLSAALAGLGFSRRPLGTGRHRTPRASARRSGRSDRSRG